MSAKSCGRVRPRLAFFASTIALVAALAGGTTSSALAHATVSPGQASSGSYVTTTVQIPHGCDGSATTIVRVSVPEGYIGVKPQPKPGWGVSTRKAAYAKTYKNHGRDVSEGVVEVTWTGGPLPDDQFDEFRLTGFMAAGAGALAFPTVQVCEKGEIAWDQRAAPGQNPHALKQPAPLMQIAEAKGGHHAGHGAAVSDLSVQAGKVVKLGDLAIVSPWARATPAGAKVGGGYLAITNSGKTPDRLIKVESNVSGRGEIHEMAMNDGVMTMRPLADGLELKPGETVTFKPGSLHLMLMDLKQPLKEGETFKVRLFFEKAGTTEIVFGVRGIAARADEADHHDHHGSGHSSK